MSQKADLTLINVRSYKELPDTEIMGVSAKAVQHRFGENLRKIIAEHGLPSQDSGRAGRADVDIPLKAPKRG
jgi:hypothetical protein